MGESTICISYRETLSGFSPNFAHKMVKYSTIKRACYKSMPRVWSLEKLRGWHFLSQFLSNLLQLSTLLTLISHHYFTFWVGVAWWDMLLCSTLKQQYFVWCFVFLCQTKYCSYHFHLVSIILYCTIYSSSQICCV